MTKETFRQRLESEIVVIDGAMGTQLQSYLKPGVCMDAANLDIPDIVAGVHRAYAKAGADIVSTNTFGASRLKLDEFRLGDRIREINLEGAKLAKTAVDPSIWIAGVIGPTGKLISPMGPLDFDETYDVFRQQALALAEGGVDLFLLETFSDLKEIKIAVMAICENTDLPVMASMTFGEDFLTFTGTDPVTTATVLTSLSVDALGVNCSTGPGPMLEILGRYALTTTIPLFVEPNAGLPRLDNKKATFQVSPAEMAEYGDQFIQIGANGIGSCCGSTPDHTMELNRRIKYKKPVIRIVNPCLRLASRVRTVEIGSNLPFAVIGERINPTNRDELAKEILAGKIAFIQREAQAEKSEGAHLVDVNISVPGTDETSMMPKAVRGIENVVDLPIVIDCVNPSAIEAALKESAGKPLINSVSGEEKSLRSILPLARRFGTGLLCLAVGEEGIPKTAEERLSVLKKIVQRAENAGISRQDLICDCLTLTVSAQQKRAEETLKAIRLVKEELGLPTVLGISNISFGLPERSLINSTFLSMAMASGLDAAIINPGDARIMETVRAASVLTVRDRDSQAFIRSHVKRKKSQKAQDEEQLLKESKEERIYRAVLTGNRDEIASFVDDVLGSGKSPIEINNQLLIPAIDEVGKRYENKEIYLPQMILAAETMQRAFQALKPHFKDADVKSKGVVILCTVKGDVHDIGKNIVGLFLQNQGFEVIDLGKNISTEMIVQKAVDLKADIVGLSALMTTTMIEMPNVIESLKKTGSKARVIVGGAVVTKKYAAEIGADGYAKDGVGAVEVVKKLIGIKSSNLCQDQ